MSGGRKDDANIERIRGPFMSGNLSHRFSHQKQQSGALLAHLLGCGKKELRDKFRHVSA
jgi:hypothetical protein